jgi:hypothetical protein
MAEMSTVPAAGRARNQVLELGFNFRSVVWSLFPDRTVNGFAQACQIKRQLLVGNCIRDAFDDQVRRFVPADVTQHHFSGQN